MKFFSEEYKKKLSEAAKKRKVHGMAGKILSLETRYKMRQAHKGYVPSEETKRKISETVRRKQMKPMKKPEIKPARPKLDGWTDVNEELGIGRTLKTDFQEFNRARDGRKPLVRYPVYGILRAH